MSAVDAGSPAAGSGAEPSVDRWLAEHHDDLVAFRRNLHEHPELSGEEYATTDLVADRLEVAGLTVRRFASGTGLVCDLDPDGTPTSPDAISSRRLALRADLDALAMDDEKDVPYRSRVPGVAHACGHDVHTTIVLGTALHFAHHRDELSGPVRFLFQPAEERVPGGALDVLADRGLEGADAIMGVHCDPRLPVGAIGLRAGPITSAADMALITLSGPGGHTARPERTVDLVTVAAEVIRRLPERVADAVDDGDAVKLVFGSVHAGDAANVIPWHCELKASIRTPSVEAWERLPDLVDATLRDLAAEYGAEYRLDYVHGVPPVVNHGGLIELLDGVGRSLLGDDGVTPAIQSWGGDDFAWFTREIPGAYVRLGVRDPAATGPPLDLHAGCFDVDERSIGVGVRLLTAATHAYHRSGTVDDDGPTAPDDAAPARTDRS